MFFSSSAPLIALPNWNQPRLVLEGGCTSQRWQDAASLDAYSLTGRMRRNALRSMSVLLPTHSLAGGTALPIGDSFVEELALSFVRKVVIVGRTDQRQKWTVVFLDSKAQPVVFLKYGQKEQARKRILHEADTLANLPRGAGPMLMKQGELASGNAFVMMPVDGEYIARHPLSSEARKQVCSWVDLLAVGQDVKIDQHPAVLRMRKEVEGYRLMDVEGAGSLLTINDQLNNWLVPLRERTWPMGWQHGDAAPWNLRVAASGQVSAIDWEDAVSEGCPLFDLVYYVIQTHFFLKGAHVDRAFGQACDWLRRKGLSPQESRSMVKLAAYDAFSRWQCDGWKENHPLQRFRLKIVDHQGGS